MKQSTKYEILLLLTALLWGAGFPITKIALESGFGPFTINAGRFLVASVVLTPVFWSQIRTMRKEHILMGATTGIFLLLGFIFQTYGIVYTTPSKNAFITQMMVILVPFVSWMIFKIKPTKHSVFGAMIALVGGFVLTYSATMLSTGINLGDALTLVCAVMVAVHIVVSTHYSSNHDINLIGFSVVQFYVVAFFSVLLALLFEDVSRETSFVSYIPLIYLGIINTAWGFTIQTFAHKHSNVSKTSIIVSTEALFATIISFLFFQEVITVQVIVGGLLILTSVLYVEWNHRDVKVVSP